MSILNRFGFNQLNLQDYLDCQRRFQLRYLDRLTWPAVPGEPLDVYEAEISIGKHFHLLVQQYYAGIPADQLRGMIQSEEELNWWELFLKYAHNVIQRDYASHPGSSLHTELSLAAPIDAIRVEGKFDLLVIVPGERAVIFDWKTTSRQPNRATYERRLQTRLYRLLVALTASHNQDRYPFKPDQIELVYWFARFPGKTLRYRYSLKEFEKDLGFIKRLAQEIDGLSPQDFLMTSNTAACRFCVYRSYCDRGSVAGDITTDEPYEPDDQAPITFDYEDLDQIPF